ncbi:CesT family type III secretion system chaperone [Noviherbaspirillum pedocola]|uniref:CesT family type III secretion system chaperone n=1 Tax=Noviherbaspirillum pedocola TaxID=2801341 RepID=A0A934SUS7_9BURK|nr:CesT family type III secretion system chaperone [Noviherbaspirillum pedocola]MBK4736965.1 CesT family type III secretion system chaperone [Noviherbaspirillum pedocola]
MPIKDFAELRLALASVVAGSPPPRHPQPDGMESLALAIAGVSFLLCHAGATHADRAFLFCEFGPLPETRRVEALERLMEMNLIFFRGNSPVFGRDPINGNILFCSEILFASVSAELLLETLRHIATQAQLWRQTFFLEAQD